MRNRRDWSWAHFLYSFKPSLPFPHLFQSLGTWFLLIAVYTEDQGTCFKGRDVYNSLKCMKNTTASSAKIQELSYICKRGWNKIKGKFYNVHRTMNIFIIQNNFKTDHILYREILPKKHSCFLMAVWTILFTTLISDTELYLLLSFWFQIILITNKKQVPPLNGLLLLWMLLKLE